MSGARSFDLFRLAAWAVIAAWCATIWAGAYFAGVWAWSVFQ